MEKATCVNCDKSILKPNISKHIKAEHSYQSRAKKHKFSENWVSSAFKTLLKDYVIPVENDEKYSCDALSLLRIIKNECLEILEKDLEKHNALKVNTTLT